MAEPDEPISLDLVLANMAWMRRLAHRLVGDAAEADDVVQQAWVEAVDHAPPAGQLRPWLAGVVKNLARMGHRSGARRRSREAAVEGEPPAQPSDVVEQLEIERAVADALLGVEEPYRTTVLLRYYKELSASEIARRLGIPAATVRWRLQRGLEELRRRLDARFGNDRRRWALALVPTAAAARSAAGVGTAAIIGGLVMAKLATKVSAAFVILCLLLLGAVSVSRHVLPTSDVTRTRPGVAWRVPGGIGNRPSSPPTMAGIALPPWFGQKGAPVRRIAGRVIFNGAPVSDATVELASDLTDAGILPTAKRRTTADGRFDFGTQPPAKFSVAATADGRSPAIVEIDTRDPTSPAERLELRLGGCGSQLFGHVNDASGGPIASARVCLAPPRAAACVNADAGGAYTMCLAPTQYWVTVSASGYGGIYDHVEFGGRRVQRDYALTPEAVIAGRVVRADTNAPVVGASVRVFSGNRESQRISAPGATTTNQQGRFSVSGLASGRQRIVAFADGLATSEAVEINVEAGKPSGDVLMRLKPGGRVSGVVTDGRDPIVGARVQLGFAAQSGGVDAITQRDGRFIIDPIGRGQARVDVGDYEVQEPKTIAIDRAEVSGVRVRVEPRASIAGHVTRAGRPIAGTLVSCSMQHDPVVSDGDGAYEIRGLAAGRYRVWAQDHTLAAGAQFDELVTLGKGERRTGVDLDLKYAGSISGLVVEPDGRPVAGALISFAAVHIEDDGSDVTGLDGSFRATMLIGGDDYRPTVRASARDRTPLQIVGAVPTVTVKDGATEVSDVRVVVRRDHLAISGRVVDANGQAVSDVRVVAFRADDRSALAFTDGGDQPSTVSATDGTFAISDLDAGGYLLHARGGDGSEAMVRDVAAGQKNVVITLQHPGGIDGVLVGFSSPPAVRAYRQLPGGGYTQNVFAIVDGTAFHFRGLSPATYQVSAIGAETDAKPVDVTAGHTATMTLQARDSTTIRGRVVEWGTGAPVAGLRCSPGLRPTGSRVPSWIWSISSFTDDAGGFVLEDAPGGDVAVFCFASNPYYAPGEAYLSTRSGQDATCEVPVVKIEPGTRETSFGALFEIGTIPCRVSMVVPQGPADRAGIRIGDVLATIDGANVENLLPGGVHWVVSRRPVGSTLHLGLLRDGRPLTADVVLVPE